MCSGGRWSDSGRGASTLSDSNYLEAATQGVNRDLGDLTIDVVYVMDLTLELEKPDYVLIQKMVPLQHWVN